MLPRSWVNLNANQSEMRILDKITADKGYVDGPRINLSPPIINSKGKFARSFKQLAAKVAS